jgi:hypothetical protein
MTTLNTDWQLGMMPDFDPIEMKEKIQAEIIRETKGMTGAEVLEFFHKGSQEFQEEMRLRRAERAKSAETSDQ